MVAYGSDADTPFMFLSLEPFVEAAALVYPSVLYFLQHLQTFYGLLSLSFCSAL